MPGVAGALGGGGPRRPPFPARAPVRAFWWWRQRRRGRGRGGGAGSRHSTLATWRTPERVTFSIVPWKGERRRRTARTPVMTGKDDGGEGW